MEVSELFNLLESNEPNVVEDIKNIIHENFNSTKDSWLLNGLFDYYLSTNSARSVEILVGVREPHDKYLFDRLTDTLKGPSKLQGLTLLGHVVRRQPTWLFKIAHHQLLKDMIKLLKAETDILALMSGLLVMIVLLPMIPSLMGPYLQEIFEVFSRLAAWNTNNPNKVPEEHLLHLQVGLYALFHRLYGMYPCNFLSYLRHEYGLRENLGIFSHTIKPMLDTVKMHPLLVTASKDAEIGNARWKKMEHHDVVVECAKYSLDTVESSREDNGYQGLASTLRGRSSLEYPAHLDPHSQIKPEAVTSTSQMLSDTELWSPSHQCGITTPPLQDSLVSVPQTPNSQEGISPPEAAVEATPETTPVKDVRHISSRLPANSNVVRALNSLNKWPVSGASTPSQSQPSSPMKKEQSPFRFPESSCGDRRESMPCLERRDSLFSQKLHRIMIDRNHTLEAADDRPTLTIEHQTSPLHISFSGVTSGHDSPVPTEGKEYLTSMDGFKDSLRLKELHSELEQNHDHYNTQEDQEVLKIVMQGQHLSTDNHAVPMVAGSQRQCDSVLHESHSPHEEDDDDSEDECKHGRGSPCMAGGLHMPNSQSMIDFAKRVHRLRFYSQCGAPPNIPENLSISSSPSDPSGFPARVRRTNSCPEIKKEQISESDVGVKIVEEKEEIEASEEEVKKYTKYMDKNMLSAIAVRNTVDMQQKSSEKCNTRHSSGTQTVDHGTPLPYEHLFLGVFPQLSVSVEPVAEFKPSPQNGHGNEEYILPKLLYSPYSMLEKYINSAINIHTKDEKEGKKIKSQALENELKKYKEQLVLLHVQLQFERHRREVHAERNRRLLGKSRNNRALEEHNSALRDQLSLLQKDSESLHHDLENERKAAKQKEQKLQEAVAYWENQCPILQKENKELKSMCEELQEEVKKKVNETDEVRKEFQKVKAELFDMGNEMKHVLEKASVGEQLQEELDQLKKELVLMGELQQRYRDRFSHLPLFRQKDEEALQLRNTFNEELKGVNQLLETRTTNLEAAKFRVAELEGLLTKKDMLIADQKRILKTVKEEYHEQLKAVESKYEAMRAINQRLESQLLEVNHQLDRTRSPGPGSSDSMTGISVREKHSVVGGFSPQSSPLSESLGSDGMSIGGLLSDVSMKNLEVIVDQQVEGKEGIAEAANGEEG